MTGVGGGHLALTLVTIQCQCVGTDFFTPEDRIKTLLQCVGGLLKLIRQLGLAKQHGQARRPQLGVIHIALHFAERNRRIGELSVTMKDGIVRIFPTLLDQTGCRAARILDKTVTIQVAITIDPIQRGENIGPDTAQESQVTRALIVGTGQTNKEWRRVYRTVITAKWNFL